MSHQIVYLFVNANLGFGRLETFKSMAGIPAIVEREYYCDE